MSNPVVSPALSLLRCGVPLSLLLDLALGPDSRSLLERERVSPASPPAR